MGVWLSCLRPSHLSWVSFLYPLYMRTGHALLARVDDKQPIRQSFAAAKRVAATATHSSAVNTHTSSHTSQSKFRTRNMILTPRSSNYERLEGGLGPTRMNGMRRFGWKKFAVGAVVIIGLVWAFGPRKESLIPQKYIPCEFLSLNFNQTCI